MDCQLKLNDGTAYIYTYLQRDPNTAMRVQDSIGGSIDADFIVFEGDKPLGAIKQSEDSTWSAITIDHRYYYGFASQEYACYFLRFVAIGCGVTAVEMLST